MELVNKNPHDAYVKNNDGTLQRVLPGQVVNADGGFADRLQETPGFDSASQSDKKAWAESNSTADAENVEQTPSGKINKALGDLRTAAQAFLAATNQVVIGDDQAPYGPPSGTVTTVQAVNDPAHFGTHSAAHVGPVGEGDTAADLIGGVEQATGAHVHNSQVEAADAANSVAEQLAGLHGGSDPKSGDGDEYEDLHGDELDAELESRGLPKSGKVEEKRERLREDDAARADADE